MPSPVRPGKPPGIANVLQDTERRARTPVTAFSSDVMSNGLVEWLDGEFRTRSVSAIEPRKRVD
jgi:hypothetical protein